MSDITLMHAKLHRFAVTAASLDYVGSVTIDADLLDAVGILPLEEVDIVNVANGARWQTYALPGPRGSGCICPNGGGARLCAPGDPLIIFAYALLGRAAVLAEGHVAQVAVADADNAIKACFTQALRPSAGGGLTFEDAIGVDPATYPRIEVA